MDLVRSLALDPVTGDLAIAAGRLRVLDGIDAITQRVSTRLRFWQGEWFADTSVGVPFLTFLGVPGSEALAESSLREAITTCPGIASLDEFSLVVGANRRGTVRFKATAVTGDVVDVRDFVAGGAT